MNHSFAKIEKGRYLDVGIKALLSSSRSPEIVRRLRTSRGMVLREAITPPLLHSSFRRQIGRTNLGGDLGGLGELTAALDALKDGLTVLVKLELGDDDVGGVDADGDGGTGGLVAGDALDVDDVLEAVDGSDLALLVLVGAADNGDLVVLADGDGADLQAVRF